MARKLLTAEELEELRRADAELEETFVQTQDEIVASRNRDRASKLDNMDSRSRQIAENQRAYREANREKYNAYMREYMRRRKAAALA